MEKFKKAKWGTHLWLFLVMDDIDVYSTKYHLEAQTGKRPPVPYQKEMPFIW